ncbi:hypothetical protein GGE45_000087 [Rhizobium aethiopicum]|uniref:Uncharacterized protein n=1 Tax=Rhizobium aethiopicum TaxID=1138170 RepID=A0A7W6MDC6_9HYPH|nr:hypothetical protein [Rhizobium aethiopicum]MBB4190604.1 hypothetical protein [Rhizobium aethiopicum]MBB4577793.1 hypothetical protein [Rhizobium aethiopicum]
MNEPGKMPPALTSTSISSKAPVTAMKRTVPPIFCEEESIADGAADQENCRRGALFQVAGLKNGSAFALHDTDLKQYIFATGQPCRHGSILWQCAVAA